MPDCPLTFATRFADCNHFTTSFSLLNQPKLLCIKLSRDQLHVLFPISRSHIFKGRHAWNNASKQDRIIGKHLMHGQRKKRQRITDSSMWEHINRICPQVSVLFPAGRSRGTQPEVRFSNEPGPGLSSRTWKSRQWHTILLKTSCCATFVWSSWSGICGLNTIAPVQSRNH